jgi:hypothetical protein
LTFETSGKKLEIIKIVVKVNLKTFKAKKINKVQKKLAMKGQRFLPNFVKNGECR